MEGSTWVDEQLIWTQHDDDDQRPEISLTRSHKSMVRGRSSSPNEERGANGFFPRTHGGLKTQDGLATQPRTLRPPRNNHRSFHRPCSGGTC